ncbi:hypothetical protein KCU61_g5651, partial [Aureobasidium melanogenum]
MDQAVILFDYDISVFGQKVRWLLGAAGVPFRRCLQPPILPRPILEGLGITYRRIPVLAIGKDIYCDSSAIVNIVQKLFPRVPTTPADKAYELFGTSICWLATRLIPSAMLTSEFLQDRQTIFPILLDPDYLSLRSSALAELRAKMTIVEKEFLKSSELWINGPELSLADIHVFWSIRWILFTLEVSNEPGFGRNNYPKIYKCLDQVVIPEVEEMSGEAATDVILHAQFLPRENQDQNDQGMMDIPLGATVSIESTDTTPGAHPQVGRLVAAEVDEVAIELENKIKLHFPRRGYIVRSA